MKTYKVKRYRKKGGRKYSSYSSKKKSSSNSRKKSVKKKSSKKKSNSSRAQTKSQIISNSYDPKQNFVIMLHVNWCGHCLDALPHFKTVQKKLKNRINMYDYDCANKNNEMLKRSVSGGYPDIFFVKNGMPMRYQQSRQANELQNNILKFFKF